MKILMTCARLDLLLKASPAGIEPSNRQTLAELNILELAGLLERDEEGIYRLTNGGRRCIDTNIRGSHDRAYAWRQGDGNVASTSR